MKTVIVLIFLLTGCANMNNAGTSSYRVKPMELSNGNVICCDITLDNGKEYAAFEARLLKHGDDYELYLNGKGVAAFRGQEIAANATLGTAATFAKATTAVIVGPAAIPAVLGVLSK